MSRRIQESSASVAPRPASKDMGGGGLVTRRCFGRSNHSINLQVELSGTPPLETRISWLLGQSSTLVRDGFESDQALMRESFCKRESP